MCEVPMTNDEIQAAIDNRPSYCCGDPATCQGVTGGECPLMQIYDADLAVIAKAASNV